MNSSHLHPLFVIAPTEGKILDPACGSGGMFVQTAHYIERHKEKGKQMNLRAFGVEKTAATVKLAKMNLVLNNVRGTITHANSYARDPYNSFGAFDYVMANPPFNVDDVETEIVKDQPRFNTYGTRFLIILGGAPTARIANATFS